MIFSSVIAFLMLKPIFIKCFNFEIKDFTEKRKFRKKVTEKRFA